MSKRPCNKLVRDNIPNIIDSQKGRKANWRILDNEQYLQELNKKLIENQNEKKINTDNILDPPA